MCTPYMLARPLSKQTTSLRHPFGCRSQGAGRQHFCPGAVCCSSVHEQVHAHSPCPDTCSVSSAWVPAAFVPLDTPVREVRSKVAHIPQHGTGPAAADAAENRLPDSPTGCVEVEYSRPPAASLEQFGSVMAMEVDTEGALPDSKAAAAQQEQPALAALPDLQAAPPQAAAQANGSLMPEAASSAAAAEEQAGPPGQGFPGFAAPAHTPAPAEAQPPWPSLPAWTPPPQAAGSKRGRDGDSTTLALSQEVSSACPWSALQQRLNSRIVSPVSQLSLQLHCMCAGTQHRALPSHALHVLQL